MVVQIDFLILHKISPLENALTEIMTLRKFVYLFKDLSSTYTVISRIGNTLEGITLIMSDGFGAEEAMVLDEGCDVFQMINPMSDDHAFTYTNDELLDRVLAFTHDQMLSDTAASTRNPVNGPALGGDMRQWPLNQNLLNQVEIDYGIRAAGLDYTDIFPVRLSRSQIRSILIVAVRKNHQ